MYFHFFFGAAAVFLTASLLGAGAITFFPAVRVLAVFFPELATSLIVADFDLLADFAPAFFGY